MRIGQATEYQKLTCKIVQKGTREVQNGQDPTEIEHDPTRKAGRRNVINA